MTVSAGEVAYRIGDSPCSGVGLLWSEEGLRSALDGGMAAVLFDDGGRWGIESILAGLAETDFSQDGIRRLLSIPDDIDDWRVGEAIAEAFLADHRSCTFPWPVGRDERKSRSSLPGADLIGFGSDDDGDCFAFGEVKTSTQRKYPPGVMHGRSGLRQQLENLRDDQFARDGLVRYLAHRVGIESWRPLFERAVSRYLQNTSDVQLYGVLVRDVPPRQDDLLALVSSLGTECPAGMRIEIVALYLPDERLNGIGAKTIAQRAGAGR